MGLANDDIGATIDSFGQVTGVSTTVKASTAESASSLVLQGTIALLMTLLIELPLSKLP